MICNNSLQCIILHNSLYLYPILLLLFIISALRVINYMKCDTLRNDLFIYRKYYVPHMRCFYQCDCLVIMQSSKSRDIYSMTAILN